MTMQPKRILFAALVSALLIPSALLVVPEVHAQESVADAARKAQAQKKPSPKPATVFTNDNIDSVKGTISVVGEIPAPPAGQTAAAQDKTKTPAVDDKSKAVPVDEKKGEEYWRKAFSDARKKLADDSRELDVLQREYNLKQQQYYTDPNAAMREQFSRQDLNDTKTKIDDKTAAVAQDKQAISDLEDALRHAGGEPAWANP
jgi:hypothetical protein